MGRLPSNKIYNCQIFGVLIPATEIQQLTVPLLLINESILAQENQFPNICSPVPLFGICNLGLPTVMPF